MSDGLGFLILAGAMLAMAGMGSMNRAKYRAYARQPQRNPLGEEEMSRLREKARGPIGLARGRAQQRLAIYERPQSLRRLERFWTVLVRIALILSAGLLAAALIAFAIE